MTLTIDVYWSFRSPWSYLATPRLADWKRQYDLNVNFRPVNPIAIRTPDFFRTVHPLWFPYFMRDVHRVAEFLELPFQWAKPDPVVIQAGDDGRPQTAKEQPYIHRLTRLGILAEEMGAGIEFAEQASGLIWTTDKWDQGDLLKEATSRAGLDLVAMDARVEAESEPLEAMIQKNEAAHLAAGHWGVPTTVFEDEPFFGQDRLDVLLWRLKGKGLQPRH